MGLLDKVKAAVAGNPDKAGSAIDKAAELARTRAGQKHRSKIDDAARKAKDYVEKLDDGPGPPPGAGAPGQRDPDGPAEPPRAPRP